MWILRANDASSEHVLRLTSGARKTVGRGPQADFVIDAPLVSRMHCSLLATETGLTVEDLQSTNGTYVNDRRVPQSPLREGDRLRLGRLELSVSRE